MYDNYGRIHRVAFKATISTFFAAAVLAVVCRIAVRIHYQKRILIDDSVLLFGCSTMIAAFALINVSVDDIYLYMRRALGPVEPELQEPPSTASVDRMIWSQQISYSAEVMCWVTIFAVKMSYLMFFRQILDRLQAQMIYWKVVTGVVIITGIYCTCSVFISCPHIGLSSIQCVRGSGFTKSVIVSQVANSVDMLTDLLIISVPIKLLRRVNIRLQQKALLCTFLCLSICMFAITLLRASRQTVDGNTGTTIDVQWNAFWQMIEACVAVIVVSLTSFRSLYGIKTLQKENKKRYENWLPTYRRNILSSKKQSQVDELGNPVSNNSHALPSIPGGTLTGMRTMISGSRKSTYGPVKGSHLLSADQAPKHDEESDAIKVVVDFDARESIKHYV